RDVQQFAVGHTCSAMWDEPVDGFVQRVRTSWFPEATVHVVSAEGDIEFRQDDARLPLAASWLASEDPASLVAGLASFVDAYAHWISRMEAGALGMPHEHVEQAQLHMQRCRTAEQRMRAGIALLESSPDVLTAF